MDYRGYHPVEYATEDHLRVTRSKFGTGYILTGSTPTECQTQHRSIQACNFSRGSKVAPTEGEIRDISQQIGSFWEAESLGCEPLPSCPAHDKNCPECRYRSQHLTAEQRNTVDEMAASLTLTDGKPPLRISYPFNEHAAYQISNHKQALAVQKAHEQRVIREGILTEYNMEMQKAIDAGNVVQLSKEEMDNWKGGTHYITHFPVIKMLSTSTKVRIVSD